MQEAEGLQQKVKSMEGLLEKQMRDVMEQLVAVMHRNESLTQESRRAIEQTRVSCLLIACRP